jgi:hypothetical protein
MRLQPDSDDVARYLLVRQRKHALHRQDLAALQRASCELAVAIVVLTRLNGTDRARNNCDHDQHTRQSSAHKQGFSVAGADPASFPRCTA